MTGGYEKLEAKDEISKGPVSHEELGSIVERLYSTQTVSFSGEGPKNAPCTNAVSREPATKEEMKEIYERLSSTKTKAFTGEDCRPVEPTKTPGYGLKMYPIIQGIETRFKDNTGPQEKVVEVIGRLHKTQTKASQSRLDNPRILLYPERTTLMNNVERITAYQQSGSIAKQNMLQRREKWFN